MQYINSPENLWIEMEKKTEMQMCTTCLCAALCMSVFPFTRRCVSAS